jgi:FAD dependent oxidoreductase
MYLSELQNGQTVKTSIENIVFDKECDVLVAGLGTAGAIAAISAAEHGAKVIGVDRLKMSGGTATAGGVFGYYYGLQGGRFEKVDEECLELSGKDFLTGDNNRHPYAKSYAIEHAMVTAGGEIIYESTVIGIYLENDMVCGVRILSKGQLTNIACKVLIDGSGDGEVSVAAGAEFELGRQLDGQAQPFSSIRIFTTEDKKLGMANFDAGYVLPNDAKDLTRGLIQANSLHRGGLENFGNGLLWLTLPPGPREGRLLKCDRTMRFTDFINGERYANPIVYAYSNFDSHTQDWAFESDDAKDWMVTASLWGYCFNIPLPAEIMFVKGFSNLLCAGRCVSIDHDMAAAVRMQRGLQKLGEAAGIIAAQAVRNNTDIRNTDRTELLAELSRSGALNTAEQRPDDKFKTDHETIRKMLASEKPGEAIWVAGKNLSAYRKLLMECLESKEEHLSRNSALALGLGGDPVAISKLLQIVEERDQFEPSSSRSHNQRRLLGAMNLLGKLGDEKAIYTLLDFIKIEDLDMQEISHALMVLLKLGDTCLEQRTLISDALTKVLDKDCPEYKLLLKNSSSTGYRAYVNRTILMRQALADKLKQWSKI